MTLREVLYEEWSKTPDAEAEDVAERVIGSVRTRGELAALVFPAVRDQAVFVRRGVIRREESAAFSQPAGASPRASAEPVDPTESRRTLLECATYVDHETGYVMWGELTVDQHEARIDFLERKIWGIARTADRHRLAVKLLTDEGAACLNDLPSIPDEFWEEA